MPLYDFKCLDDSCGTLAEGYVALQDFPKTLPCPKCGGATEKDLNVRREVRSAADPVVVYQAPDGTFRFPPDINSSSTAMYESQGMTRIELRGWADVRRFETHMNKAELSNVRRRVERQQEQHEAQESARRSEIRRCMDQGFQIPEVDDKGRQTGRMQRVPVTPRLRAIMQAAIDRNDRKGGPRVHEPGFHVEAYQMDRSNRDADPHRRDQ